MRIGDDVEIGANTCIDRGALGDTEIGDGVKIDNLVQIGHNVKIGAHSAIAGNCGIAGSSTIGAHCMLGGGVGVSGHVTLADHVVVTGATQVSRSIRKAGLYSGSFPFDDNAAWEKNAATLRNLHALRERVRALEKKIFMTTLDIHQILKQLPHRYPVPDGRSRARARARQAHQGAEERHRQRALFPGPLSRSGR